jgi:2-dehydropantoate 2-reductase
MVDERILIWGAGAIGGTLGAYWARAGVPVLLVDVDAEHVAMCRTRGLHIFGPIDDFTQQIQAVTPAEVVGTFSRTVLATKAQATAAAIRQLAPHLAVDGFVLSAQNGLNEIEIAAVVGEARTLGCFVNFGADWHAPGEILFGNRAAVVVGELDGQVRSRTHDMHALLKIFEPDAVLTENIWGYLWGKLAYGAMLFATALTTDSMSENFADPRRSVVFETLGREVMAVAKARQVQPIGFNGFDPNDFMPQASSTQAQRTIAQLAEFNRHTAKTHSGIYRDLAVRKRRTEIDAQIGIIVTLGQAAGVATPALAQLVTLIHDIERGHRSLSFATFQVMIDTCNSALTTARSS